MVPSENWLMNKGSANAMATQIREYWREKGYYGIQTFVVPSFTPVGRHGPVEIYSIRSNIGPLGYPPKMPNAAVAA
jgi:hypothetical protein